MDTTRSDSWQLVDSLGMPTNRSLPEIEVNSPRREEEVVQRLLALFCVVAASFGFPKQQAAEWLDQENLSLALTDKESEFLHSQLEPTPFQHQVEALFALAWALSLVDELPWGRLPPDNFVTMFPELKVMESAEELRPRLELRPRAELMRRLDEAYCLHWACRQMLLDNEPPPLREYVFRERRRSLEWLNGNGSWDEIDFDT